MNAWKKLSILKKKNRLLFDQRKNSSAITGGSIINTKERIGIPTQNGGEGGTRHIMRERASVIPPPVKRKEGRMDCAIFSLSLQQGGKKIRSLSPESYRQIT